jgi:hypothetical protein
VVLVETRPNEEAELRNDPVELAHSTAFVVKLATPPMEFEAALVLAVHPVGRPEAIELKFSVYPALGRLSCADDG